MAKIVKFRFVSLDGMMVKLTVSIDPPLFFSRCFDNGSEYIVEAFLSLLRVIKMKTSVSLKRVDQVADSKNYIELSCGKTTIGRGPILKCTVPRVSRNHAILDVSKDEKLVTITPIHVNPCFYKASDDEEFVELPKNEAKSLKNGDKFSLLPSSLMYEIVIEESNDVTNGNNVSDVQSDQVNLPEPSDTRDETQETDDLSESSNTSRKRTLPKWLIDLGSGKELDRPETSTKRKRAPTRKKAVSPKLKKADETDEKPKGEPSKRNDISDDSSTSKAGSLNQNSATKKKCPYGSQCYRKNPAHFEEFSHDDSVKDENDDDDDDGDEDDARPECEFGRDCYRKNLQHRKDFKHTKRVRLAAKKARSKQKDEDEDDGDSVDSFIVDDDDSDEYKPQTSSDTDDDLNDLIKEAEQFKRNKKMLQSTT